MGESVSKAQWILVCAMAVAASGCGLSLTDGGLSCSSKGECPSGYHCAPVDNTCWKNGHDPLNPNGDGDMSVDSTENGDMGPALPDLDSPPDLTPILTNGQLCGSKADCVSGNCVDGVCCDAPCTEAC